MTTRRVWLGSTGPFLYDDSVLYIDEDGVISPDNQQAIATDGQVVVQSAPSSPVHVVRKQDLDDALGDISGLDARVISLEAQVTSLNSRVTTAEGKITALEGKFVVNTTPMTFTGFTVEFTATPYYIKVDRYVTVQIPQVTGTSAINFIRIYGWSSDIVPPLSNVAIPVYVHDATNGYNWGVGTFINSGGWYFEITQPVDGAGFPSSGPKTLPPQMLFWSK